MRLIIVSGRSGSGKSISLHLLEDLGYYCIDNLPASLLPILVNHISHKYQHIGIGIDARNLPHDIDQFHKVIETINATGNQCEIIYLDAEDSTLIKRFSETRRKHPLSDKSTSLQEAIQREKILLEPIAHIADLRVDTTHFTMHQLHKLIRDRVLKHRKKLSLLIQSFGFKFGIPIDSDYVFDVRCLPNPYWQLELRRFTGLDHQIQKFLLEKPETQEMLTDIKQFLSKWIPCYEKDHRSYMTISIGCTGGQHRSVFIVEQLKEFFNQQETICQIRHRELA